MQSYLAFGDDEETLNLGAKAISDHLKAQSVTLEFALDEGGGKIESGAAFGAPDISIAHVDLMEKGYEVMLMVNTSTQPEMMPGRLRGNTTLEKVWKGEAPRL